MLSVLCTCRSLTSLGSCPPQLRDRTVNCVNVPGRECNNAAFSSCLASQPLHVHQFILIIEFGLAVARVLHKAAHTGQQARLGGKPLPMPGPPPRPPPAIQTPTPRTATPPDGGLIPKRFFPAVADKRDGSLRSSRIRQGGSVGSIVRGCLRMSRNPAASDWYWQKS